MLVDGSPEPMLFACNSDDDLIKVPLVTKCGQTPADPFGKALAELHRPLPHRLMADQDASRGEHLLHHAEAQGKAEVEPDGMADHLSRKAVAGITRGTDRLHPSRIARSGSLIG